MMEIAEQHEQEFTVYERPDHFLPLNRMRARVELCDITIKVENKSFRAHKIILAGTISFFERMFLSNFEDSNKDVISLKDIKKETMEALIDFAYTGVIIISEENVQALAKDADYLGLDDVKEECVNFLSSCIECDNFFEINRLAETLNSTSLAKICDKFMRDNFDDILQTNECLNLHFTHLRDLLSGNNLKLLSQEKVFNAVMRWMMHDINERKNLLGDLLSLVKLADLSADYIITYLRKGEMAVIVDQQKDLVYTIIDRYYKMKTQPIKNRILAMKLCKPKDIEIYNPRTEQWEVTDIPDSLRHYFSCTVLDDKLYILGGQINYAYTSLAEVYDINAKTWTKISPMDTERRSAGAAALDGFIYVCGGEDASSYDVDTVERYCPITDEWITLSSMKQNRRSPAVVAFQGHIYALGGDEIKNNILDSMERYDAVLDEWTIIDARMKKARSRFAAAVLNGKLYVCGGWDGDRGNLNSVEVYDPITNRWSNVASMRNERSNFFVVASEGKLWAIGGYSYTVEVYDPDKNTWSYGPAMENACNWVTGSLLPT